MKKLLNVVTAKSTANLLNVSDRTAQRILTEIRHNKGKTHVIVLDLVDYLGIDLDRYVLISEFLKRA